MKDRGLRRKKERERIRYVKRKRHSQYKWRNQWKTITVTIKDSFRKERLSLTLLGSRVERMDTQKKTQVRNKGVQQKEIIIRLKELQKGKSNFLPRRQNLSHLKRWLHSPSHSTLAFNSSFGEISLKRREEAGSDKTYDEEKTKSSESDIPCDVKLFLLFNKFLWDGISTWHDDSCDEELMGLLPKLGQNSWHPDDDVIFLFLSQMVSDFKGTFE